MYTFSENVLDETGTYCEIVKTKERHSLKIETDSLTCYTADFEGIGNGQEPRKLGEGKIYKERSMQSLM